jgi:hypothetical protein
MILPRCEDPIPYIWTSLTSNFSTVAIDFLHFIRSINSGSKWSEWVWVTVIASGIRYKSSGVSIEVGSATIIVPSADMMINEFVGVKLDLLTFEL